MFVEFSAPMLVFIKYQALPEVPPVGTVDCPDYRINYTDIRGMGNNFIWVILRYLRNL